MTAPDYGSPIFAAWRAAAPDWDAYTRHDFVEVMYARKFGVDSFLPFTVRL